jgi:hypothetical protein
MKIPLSIVTVFALLILAAGACKKETISCIGFSSEFLANSKGLTLMEVKNNVEFLTLIGKIEIKKGSIEVKLLNPDEFAVYTSEVESPGIIHINRTFRSTTGFWKLSYQSIEGEGTIDLHLTNSK